VIFEVLTAVKIKVVVFWIVEIKASKPSGTVVSYPEDRDLNFIVFDKNCHQLHSKETTLS
jgi:hypothetical protein